MAAAAAAAATAAAVEPSPTEVLPWLKSLPLAPEFRPTLAEFQDPISYILKIEREASAYGICKIVPPLPAAPRKTAVANLNRSFAARDPNPKKPPTFTTRQQQVGFCPRRPRPVQKPVWQSGEHYTLQQFEAKARQFERAQARRAGRRGAPLPPLEVETLFWKACADKPSFSVEYANDVPGSGFPPLGGAGGRRWREEEAAHVGETAWNMRGVSRAHGSLLRFMKEEIPGVTSPMVYVAMMFSWFAWHVEDHELHSLNYLHLGAGKTWYGVPRDAALAFEEVVRVQGYGGEVNPLVTFAILGEKTTVMSPEVIIGAGIPCCRLVQNAGEFVVTFPGAYHSGFSHGFNCGEAANIATPAWLMVAKEAAIRRASINYPPMVSHFQLLYSLALSLCSRIPMTGGIEPRSSRLKDKLKGEGEQMVKHIFLQSVIQNNDLLSILIDEGSSCVVLPQNARDSPLCPNSFTRSQIKVKPRLSLGLCSHEEALEASRLLPSDYVNLGWNDEIRDFNGFTPVKGNSLSVCLGKTIPSVSSSNYGAVDPYSSSSDLQNVEGEKERTLQADGLLDQGLLSCVTCGILSFACVAVVQPREAAAKYLMSADCHLLHNHITGTGEFSNLNKERNGNLNSDILLAASGYVGKHFEDKVDDNLVPCRPYTLQVSDQSPEVNSDITSQKGISALDLLASAYGDQSDSDEEVQHEKSIRTDEDDMKGSSSCKGDQQPTLAKSQNLCSSEVRHGETDLQSAAADCSDGASSQNSHITNSSGDLKRMANISTLDKCQLKTFSRRNQPEKSKTVGASTLEDIREMPASSSSINPMEEPIDLRFTESDETFRTKHNTNANKSNATVGNPASGLADLSIPPVFCYDSAGPTGKAAKPATMTPLRNVGTKMEKSTMTTIQISDKDSSRMHVFCLEHAAEVEKQLQSIGGVHIMLLCHPDYPKIEEEAKLLAEELGIDYTWKDVRFREATKEDQGRIRSALEDEEAIPTNSDWAVKLGINLYYSANLSKSPLYSKQMPYNAVIYKAFGCNSPGSSPVKAKVAGRRPGRQKKIVVAGRWCGKVWMSNQVHPYLAHRIEAQERERAERSYLQISDREHAFIRDTDHASHVAPIKRNSSGGNTTTSRRSGRKRNKQVRKARTKKPRCTQIDNSKSEDVTETSAPCGRVLRSSHAKNTGISARQKLNLKDEASARQKLNLKDEGEGGPSTRLRKRPSKSEQFKTKLANKKQIRKRKARKAQAKNLTSRDEDGEYACDIEGCSMSFSTKQDLTLHKRDICPVKGCGKKFFSHKYLVQHRKVHMDDRPLECPWKGCEMTFKWAWARTEHIRVHTGDRPYVCLEPGCGQTFRFVSDFSRHKRKTGHSKKKSWR